MRSSFLEKLTLKIVCIAIFSFLFSSSFLLAADIQQESTQQAIRNAHEPEKKLIAIKLLQSVDNPEHMLFIGGQELGQGIRLYDIQRGRRIDLTTDITEQQIGATIRISLSDGTTLFVKDFQNNMDIALAAITYPLLAREILKDVPVNESNLSRAGLLDLVTPGTNQGTSKEFVRSNIALEPPFSSNEQGTLILYSFQKQTNSKELFKDLVSDDTVRPALLNFLRGNKNIIACSAKVENEIIERVKSIAGSDSVEVIHEIPFRATTVADIHPINTKKDLAKTIEKLSSKSVSVLNKIKIIFQLETTTSLKKLIHLDTQTEASLVLALENFFEELNSIYSNIYSFAHKQQSLRLKQLTPMPNDRARYKEFALKAYLATEDHPIYQQFGRPIKNIQKKLLHIFHYNISSPLSYSKVLALAGQSSGAGLDLLRFTTKTGLSYLDFSLLTLSKLIYEANEIPAGLTLDEKLDLGWIPASMAMKFRPNISSELLESLWVKNSTYEEFEQYFLTIGIDTNFFQNVFVLLGLNTNARIEKKKILNFIFQADNAVKEQLDRENKSEVNRLSQSQCQHGHNCGSEPQKKSDQMTQTLSTGNALLNEFISALGAYAENRFHFYPGYSDVYYSNNVLDIFIELMQLSDNLKNVGTYHEILSSSLSLLSLLDRQQIEDDLGLEQFQADELIQKARQDMTTKTTVLKNIIQQKLLKTVHKLGGNTPCENYLTQKTTK